ncbi:MAG: c-type cytochrome [Gammaproteobacteria bacterium]|nr:c-type cytochrome [Gammaproteobacteria bacterium]
MKFATSAVLGVLLSFAASSVLASVSATAEMCNGCHGSAGVSEWTDMPTIAGIDAFVHSDALFVYRDEARPCAKSEYRQGDKCGEATTMCAIAKNMSDAEIEAIAEHYAALPFVPANQEFDAELAKTGEEVHSRECSRCHSAGGSDPADEASILAGQWMGYLEATFAAYASGEREQPKKMKDKMETLSGDDVKALLHYYASQQ